MHTPTEQLFDAIAQDNLSLIKQLYKNNNKILYETNTAGVLPAVFAREKKCILIDSWIRKQYAKHLFDAIKSFDEKDSERTMKFAVYYIELYNPLLNVRHTNEDTLLHLAVARDDQNLVTLLLHHIKINNIPCITYANADGKDFVMLALESDNIPMLLHITNTLKKETKWPEQDLLMTLALSRKLDNSENDALIKERIQNFPRWLFLKSYEGIYLLHKLIELGDKEIVSLLLTNYPCFKLEINHEGQYPVEIFAAANQWDMVLLSMDSKIPLEYLYKAIVLAIPRGAKQNTVLSACIKKCLEIYVNDPHFYPILKQAKENNNEAMFTLVWEKLSTDGKGSSLKIAIEKWDLDMVLLLCERLPKIESSDWYDLVLKRLIQLRKKSSDETLLLKCIEKLLQVGIPAEDQNWMSLAANHDDFEVILVFLKADPSYVKWFWEGASALDILVHSKRFYPESEKGFMEGCLAIIKEINSLPTPVFPQIANKAFFNSANTIAHPSLKVRTKLLNLVFDIMECAEIANKNNEKRICKNIIEAILEKDVDLDSLCQSSDYALKFFITHGYKKLILGLSEKGLTNRMPEMNTLYEEHKNFWKFDIPMLMLLARNDYNSLFSFMTSDLIKMVYNRAVSFFIKGEIQSFYQHHHFLPYIPRTESTGSTAFKLFQKAYGEAHSFFDKGSVESQKLMTDLANIAKADLPTTYTFKGRIYMRIHQFISERYASGNFTETSTIALIKQYDLISNEELLDLRKKYTKLAGITTMVGEFNKLNGCSTASKNLMKDLLTIVSLMHLSPDKRYAICREHSLDYLRAKARETGGKIEITKTIALLQKFQEISVADIKTICRTYNAVSSHIEVKVDEGDNSDFNFTMM